MTGDLDTITQKFHEATVSLVAKQLITDDHKNQSTHFSADSVTQKACPSVKPKQTGSSLKTQPDEPLTQPNSLHDGQEAVHSESIMYGAHLDWYLMNTLDAAYNKVRSTAVSHVSTTIRRKADRLTGDLDTITQKFHEATVSLVAKQLITDDHKNQSTHFSADSVKNTSSEYSATTIQRYLNEQFTCNNEYMYDQRADSASINLTELPKILAESFNTTRLPAPEPPILSGDALESHRWKCAYQTLIECKSVKPSERLHFLERYVAGQVKKLIDIVFCYQINISRYNRAKEVLEKRFGNAFVVSEAIHDRLYNWPEIDGKDHIGLRDFANYFQQCNMAMEHLE